MAIRGLLAVVLTATAIVEALPVRDISLEKFHSSFAQRQHHQTVEFAAKNVCAGQSCNVADASGSTGRLPSVRPEGGSDDDVNCILKYNPDLGTVIKSLPAGPKQSTGFSSTFHGLLNSVWKPMIAASGGATEKGTFTASCSPNILIFAKGTFETGELGLTVGPKLSSALSAVPGWTVAGVAYDANIPGDYCLGLPGGMVAKDLINQAAQKCPTSNLYVSGYSQGAMVARNGLAYADAVAKSHVKGMLLYGDPFQGAPIRGWTGPVATFCHSDDGVCTGNFELTMSHLAYARDDTLPKGVEALKDMAAGAWKGDVISALLPTPLASDVLPAQLNAPSSPRVSPSAVPVKATTSPQILPSPRSSTKLSSKPTSKPPVSSPPTSGKPTPSSPVSPSSTSARSKASQTTRPTVPPASTTSTNPGDMPNATLSPAMTAVPDPNAPLSSSPSEPAASPTQPIDSSNGATAPGTVGSPGQAIVLEYPSLSLPVLLGETGPPLVPQYTGIPITLPDAAGEGYSPAFSPPPESAPQGVYSPTQPDDVNGQESNPYVPPPSPATSTSGLASGPYGSASSDQILGFSPVFGGGAVSSQLGDSQLPYVPSQQSLPLPPLPPYLQQAPYQQSSTGQGLQGFNPVFGAGGGGGGGSGGAIAPSDDGEGPDSWSIDRKGLS